MDNKKVEKKEIKEVEKKLDKKAFKRISDEFQQYRRYLVRLILVYIACYSVWFFVAEGIGRFLRTHGYDKNSWILVISIAIFQGLIFALDGFVTALLKSPFNQMCYAINKAEGIPYKKKSYIIRKATESNEHCKETLKKMGMLTIVAEMIRIFVVGKEMVDKDLGPHASWLLLSYFIPLTFTAIDMIQIDREIKKIKKSLVVNHAEKEPTTK